MSSVRPGDVLAGKYRVERVLGTGGMGIVVAARHLQLDQLVALKFLRKGTIENDEATARFLREAKAVVKLRNEHIAKVFDVGTLDTGEPYIVMEYLEGCDLSTMAKQRGSITASEAAEYVLQACEALAEAHSLGIIHRDIKLANLFVTRGPAGTPLVKVLDFGISKTNPFGESEHDMTRTTSMLGSPRFMSPEQMRDPRAVDGRTDLWSLGVVLYRLVSGKPPFEAETLGRLLTMVMHEKEDHLSLVCPDLPLGFADLVDRCLQKEPEGRFGNVAELAYALVGYCVEPHRARGTADRIAATLSLSQLPFTASQTGPFLPQPMPSSPSFGTGSGAGPISAPRGQVDTGTASPWAGTHGGHRVSANRLGLVAAGVALGALIVSAALYAKYNSSPSAPTTSAAPAVPTETAAMATPATAIAPAVETAPAVIPAVGSVVGASPMPGTTSTVVPMGTTRPAVFSAGSHGPTRTKPAARPTTKPAGGDDGIPNSRD